MKSGGAGGSELNFTVVGGTTQPTNPSENMIWVNTDAEITGWLFSATEPEAPSQGMLWIVTGSLSNVAFDIVKKVSAKIYPVRVKQYVSGAWVDVTAMTYQGSEWVEWWNGELYINGNQYEGITGGWWQNPNLYMESYTNQTPVTFGDKISFSVPNGYSTNAITKNKIDLTEFESLSFDFTGGTDDVSKVFILSKNSGRFDNDYVAMTTTSPLPLSSIEGEYYICIGVWNGRYPSFGNIRLNK